MKVQQIHTRAINLTTEIQDYLISVSFEGRNRWGRDFQFGDQMTFGDIRVYKGDSDITELISAMLFEGANQIVNSTENFVKIYNFLQTLIANGQAII